MPSKTKRLVKPLLLVFLGLLAALVLAIGVRKLMPFPELVQFINRQNSSRFYDREGELLYILPLEQGLRREWLPLSHIPPAVQDAFIAAEDKNFYRHHGIDLAALFRALSQNIKTGRRVSGASTLTMQLVRLVVPRKTANISLSQKILEMWQALRIEDKLSKAQILELYLNSVPFGYQVEGVASAARSFFGAVPVQLTPDQIETLVGIPRRPAAFTPPAHSAFVYPFESPHFILWVIGQYKKEGRAIPNDITLSVDNQLNKAVALSIRQKLDAHADARISNGAAFAIDNRTGEIIVWVGNADFYDEKSGQVDGVLVKNRPGSSTKPFLYALALENGFNPNQVLPDVPSDFGREQVYVPLNFNNRYNGPQLLRTCLASSLNIPAVYVLYNLGIDVFLRTLEDLGCDSVAGTRNSTGLALALGSNGIPLFELVRAFSVFPRDGSVPQVRWEKTAQDAEVLMQVFKKDTCRIMCDMLSDRKARALAFGYAKVFDTPYPSIFKTGTSNQFQDIVALGATPRFSAGVWMGNYSGETVISETGSSIPASVVRSILDTVTLSAAFSAVEGQNENFKQPEAWVKVRICALSGMRATPLCPEQTTEYFIKGESQPNCNWHYRNGGQLGVRYPEEYQRWLSGKNMIGELNTAEKNTLRFIYPLSGATYVYDYALSAEKQKVPIEAIGGGAAAQIYVNGVFTKTIKKPFRFYLALKPGRHTIEIISENQSAELVIAVK